MNGVVITDWSLGAPFSVNHVDECFYTHTMGKTEKDTFTHKISGQKTPFMEVLIYALVHEQLHLTIRKLGEDDDCIHNYWVTQWIYWVLGLDIDLSSIKQTKRTCEDG